MSSKVKGRFCGDCAKHEAARTKVRAAKIFMCFGSYFVIPSEVEESQYSRNIQRCLDVARHDKEAGTQLALHHGSSNNRNNQERPLHCDGRSGIDRRAWKQVPGRKTDGSLSLRRIY